jgi:hypothetical protein
MHQRMVFLLSCPSHPYVMPLIHHNKWFLIFQHHPTYQIPNVYLHTQVVHLENNLLGFTLCYQKNNNKMKPCSDVEQCIIWRSLLTSTSRYFFSFRKGTDTFLEKSRSHQHCLYLKFSAVSASFLMLLRQPADASWSFSSEEPIVFRRNWNISWKTHGT